MGCGSSTAAGASAPGARDPEDYTLDKVEFKKFNVPKFDDFTASLAAPVNSMVDIVNTINGAITDVQDAVAVASGAYRVQVTTKGAKDHDRVCISLAKVDGTPLVPDEIKGLAAKVKDPNAKLTKAKDALHAALEKKNASLKVGADGLLASATEGAALPAEATAFNTAFTALGTALGATYKLSLAHVPAGAAGAAGVKVKLGKPTFKDPKSTAYSLAAIGVIEVASTKNAKAIWAAELGAAKSAAAFAKALKGVAADDTKLTQKGKSLAVTFPSDTERAKLEKADRKVRAKAAKAKGGKGEKEEEEKEESGGAVGEGVEGRAWGRPVAEGDEDEEGGGEEAAAEEPAAEEEAAAEEPAAEEEAAEEEAAEEPVEEEQEEEEEEEEEDDDEEDEEGNPKPKVPKAPKAAKPGAKPAAPKKPYSGPPIDIKKDDPKAAEKAELKKAIAALNAETFKLGKQAGSINGPLSIGGGVLAIFEGVKKWAADEFKAKGAAFDPTKVITVNPTVKNGDEGLDFDLGIKVNVPGQGELNLDQLLTKLPGGVQLVYKALYAIKDKVKSIMPKFAVIKDQVSKLISSADKVFSDPATDIKNALASADAMSIMRTVAAVPQNLIKIKDCVKTTAAMVSTLSRVSGELTNSFADLKKALNPAPAA